MEANKGLLFKELETNRLTLKNISFEDRDFIFEQFSNNEVNKYLFDAEPLVDIQGADEIIHFYTQPEPRSQHRWILVKKDDGIKIGTCGFHAWDKMNDYCDVGYDLYPDFWNKGYMSEALKAILQFARNDMKIRKVSAHIYFDNDKSIAIVEKFGFKFSGKKYNCIFRGKDYLHKIYSLDFTVV